MERQRPSTHLTSKSAKARSTGTSDLTAPARRLTIRPLLGLHRASVGRAEHWCLRCSCSREGGAKMAGPPTEASSVEVHSRLRLRADGGSPHRGDPRFMSQPLFQPTPPADEIVDRDLPIDIGPELSCSPLTESERLSAPW